jgi:hypothetical protein
VVIVICASAFPAVAHWVVRRREKRAAAEGGAPVPPVVEQPATD